MKKLIAWAAIFIISLPAYTQEKTIDKFAYVICMQKGMGLSAKVNAYIDSGQVTKLMKDYRAKDEDGAIDFYGVVNVLNYMSKHGWTFINAYPVSSGIGGNVYNFYFRKSVPLSEFPVMVAEDKKDSKN